MTEQVRVEALCRCKATWRTSVRTNLDVLDPRPPILPLTADEPCPRCGSTERVIKVSP